MRITTSAKPARAPAPSVALGRVAYHASGMTDLSEYSEKLATVRGVLFGVYPKIWGTREKGRAIYEVFRATGAGGWSRMLRTHDRSRAWALYEASRDGVECYISMRDALTHDLLGEVGRAPAHLVDVLIDIYEKLLVVKKGEKVGVKSVRFLNGQERNFHQSRDKKALLEAQADAISRMFWLPNEN